jgi:hypothetical protein
VAEDDAGVRVYLQAHQATTEVKDNTLYL